MSGLFGLAGSTRNDEVVVDAEHPGSGVGLDAGNGLIAVVVDDPVEGNVSTFHNDADGMKAPRRVICDAAGHNATLRPPGPIACARLPWLALYFRRAGWV